MAVGLLINPRYLSVVIYTDSPEIFIAGDTAENR